MYDRYFKINLFLGFLFSDIHFVPIPYYLSLCVYVAVAKKKVYEKEDEGDVQIEKAGGNLNADGDKYRDAKTDFWGKSLAKKDVRKFEKAQKKGDVAAMRKILLIPVGKVMPGFESLGDGK